MREESSVRGASNGRATARGHVKLAFPLHMRRGSPRSSVGQMGFMGENTDVIYYVKISIIECLKHYISNISCNTIIKRSFGRSPLNVMDALWVRACAVGMSKRVELRASGPRDL